MKVLKTLILCLLFASPAFGLVGDNDHNGAMDVAKGGTNGVVWNEEIIVVSGAHRATKYSNSADVVQRIDIFHDAAVDGNYDTAATVGSIQWAIAQLPAAGGLVYIHPGTYRIADVDNDTFGITILASNITICGAGDTTIIKPVDAHDTQLSLIRVGQETPTINTVSIKNLKLDGNASTFAHTISNGIYCSNVDYFTLDNVIAVDGGGTDGHAILAIGCDYFLINNFQKGNFAVNSIEVRDSELCTISNCRLTQRIELYSTTRNIAILNTTMIDDTISMYTYASSTIGNGALIQGCKFYAFDGSITGLTLSNSKNIIVTGCEFYGDSDVLNMTNGTGASSNISITGNVFRGGQIVVSGNCNNGMISGNTFECNINWVAGIKDYGSSAPTDWTIQNNIFVADATKNAYGINIDGATRWVIKNNSFYNFAIESAMHLQDGDLTGCIFEGNEAENCVKLFDLSGNPTGAIRFGQNYKEQESYVASYGAGTAQTVRIFPLSELTSNGDAAAETGALGDGLYKGQEVWISMAVDGGDAWELSITHHVTSDPEVATFDDAGDYLHLRWLGAEWMTVAGTCTF